MRLRDALRNCGSHPTRSTPTTKIAALLDPELQFFQICNAATWLCPADRDQFWSAVATELQQLSELGEGVIARVIAAAFLRLFQPFEIAEEPNLLGKLTNGSRRYEAKLDAIEAQRARRRARR